jgi:hypothetical protein
MSNHLTVGQLFHHLYDVCDQRSLDTNVCFKERQFLSSVFIERLRAENSNCDP